MKKNICSNKDYRADVLKKIYKFKHLPFGKTAINCNFSGLNYKLVLMTAQCASKSSLMQMIGKWRKDNEVWFSAKFEVNTKRTTIWFKERLINAPDRLLFLIKVRNEYIGHMGFFRFEFEKRLCQIDNIIRGRPGYPGIMENAIAYMLDWGRQNLGLRTYTLLGASDNKRALKLYKRLGFVLLKKIPLIQVQGNEGLEWIKAPKDYTKKIKRYDCFMRLSEIQV